MSSFSTALICYHFQHLYVIIFNSNVIIVIQRFSPPSLSTSIVINIADNSIILKLQIAIFLYFQTNLYLSPSYHTLLLIATILNSRKTSLLESVEVETLLYGDKRSSDDFLYLMENLQQLQTRCNAVKLTIF